MKEFKLKKGFNDCTSEEYHSDRKFYSSSALKLLLGDKNAFYKKYILNEKVTEKINHNFVFGSFIHSLLLEPHLVDEEFTVFSGNKSSDEYKEFLKENKGKQILTQTAWANGLHLAAIARESGHHDYITGGAAEKTLCGKIRKMPIKVRADYIREDDYILDIKTTSLDINDIEKVKTACANYGYALSAALYFDMFKTKHPKLKRFLFWFINKQSGESRIFQASEEFLEAGRKKYLKAIDIYERCVENNNWEDDFPLLFPKY